MDPSKPQLFIDSFQLPTRKNPGPQKTKKPPVRKPPRKPKVRKPSKKAALKERTSKRRPEPTPAEVEAKKQARREYDQKRRQTLERKELQRRVAQAIRNGLVSQDGCADLFEADLIISALDNRHAVVEVSLTADRDDIDRAKTRAGILEAITEGAVTPVVITSRLNPAQSAQAEAAGVTTFVIPYP